MAEKEIGNIDQITEDNFLRYSAAVIRSRAIPKAEDNLKPVHRKIIYTLKLMKLTSDKEPRKSMAVVGEVLKLSPHGDAATYGAAVRLAQWWKIRYPLVEMQGNCGNLLGDRPSAARYTNMHLSKIGDLMLDGIERNAVPFKPNYDETMQEPVTLPSKFPYILCGNNSGIAVGMSSEIVSHNFTEVAEAIKYCIKNPTCSIADLMQFIKGPDFPTGGKIINGQDLINIYTTGSGAVKVQPHFDVVKLSGGKHRLIFHDLPYGVDIDSGIKAPLKKMVVEEGMDYFEDFDVLKVGPKNFDIIITISKGVDPASAINTLFAKTRLQDSVKINNTFIINGEPKILNLKQMICYWVNYRHSIIIRVAKDDLEKANHKFTIVLGLQKCMSNIDKLIQLIRGSDTRDAAKKAIKGEFDLNDEQADAVLDMKLSRLNKLDLVDLKNQENDLRDKVNKLKEVITTPEVRNQIICKDLDDIKKIVGEDKRLTEICSSSSVNRITTSPAKPKAEVNVGKISVKKDVIIKNNDNQPIAVLNIEDPGDIYLYDEQGRAKNINDSTVQLNPIGAFVWDKDYDYMVTVTKKGIGKVSPLSDYSRSKNLLCGLKDGDKLVYVGLAKKGDYLILFNGQDKVLKLRIDDIKVSSRTCIGSAVAKFEVKSAAVVNDKSYLLFLNAENQLKLVSSSDFVAGSKRTTGETISPAVLMRAFDTNRETVVVTFVSGSSKELSAKKISIRTKNAAGAQISARKILNVY